MQKNLIQKSNDSKTFTSMKIEYLLPSGVSKNMIRSIDKMDAENIPTKNAF